MGCVVTVCVVYLVCGGGGGRATPSRGVAVSVLGCIRWLHSVACQWCSLRVPVCDGYDGGVWCVCVRVYGAASCV